MKIFDYPEAKQVLVSGDIHGDFKGLVFKLCVQYGCRDTLLIVAGDCGFGFEKPGYYETGYNRVAGRLRKANNWIVFVRGNHDNPMYFTEETIHYNRWRAVPDYSIIRACGANILCVGGAVSVDRHIRKRENSIRLDRFQVACWWPDEAPVFRAEEIEAIPDNVKIDTVVSHTAPSWCALQSKTGLLSWAREDPGLIDDVEQERQTMNDLCECLTNHGHPLRYWYYGHFHQSWSRWIDDVLYSMLDIEEFKSITTEEEV